MSEQLWAGPLKKQKFKTRIPLSEQEKNLKERLAYQKTVLLKAIEKRDNQTVKANFQSLLELRARLLFLRLQKTKTETGFIDDKILKDEARSFAWEGINLGKALNITF